MPTSLGHCFAGGAFLAISHDYTVMRKDRGWICWNEILLKRTPKGGDGSLNDIIRYDDKECIIENKNSAYEEVKTYAK